MLWHVARFELGQHLRRLSTWLYCIIFCAIAYLLCIAAAGAFESVDLGLGTGGKVMVNSPYTLVLFISLTSYFTLGVIAALAGQAVHQDFQYSTYTLFFAAPLAGIPR